MTLHLILLAGVPLVTWADCDNSSTSCANDASLLLQLGGAARSSSVESSSSARGDYEKRSGSYCPNHNEFRSYNSLASAQSACDSDSGCSGLYDYGCGGYEFYLCRAPLQAYTSSSSCVHVKSSSPSPSSDSPRRRRSAGKGKGTNSHRRRRRRRTVEAPSPPAPDVPSPPTQVDTQSRDPFASQTCATYTCPSGWAKRNPGSTRISQWECCEETCATYNCPSGWERQNLASTHCSWQNCCQRQREATCATYTCPAGWTTKNQDSTRLSQAFAVGVLSAADLRNLCLPSRLDY
eukprot:TRINITY_DN2930_c0_g1_i2.p1 TRINITY_DN2930_c0_g1~~TRINITY_DN2930_c0_g1_i2.p1  ORF type:complete len:293 (-),score=14.27 TRINITY_DN2930_c0_g1_i2:193-1071(-)